MSQGIISGNVQSLEVRNVTIDLASVSANTTAVTSVTVPGLKTEDSVFVNKPSHEAGLGIVNARVSAEDTMEVTAMNTTASPIDEASETFKVLIVKAAL